jgi:hypothetical protein
MLIKLDRIGVAGCAVAALLTFGCGNNDHRTGTNLGEPRASAPQTTPADQHPPIRLTGCLQKTDGVLGGEYILTQANLSRDAQVPVGTTGLVQQKQMKAAMRSYRLNGETGQLRGLLGHRVRIEGTLIDQGVLATGADFHDTHLKTDGKLKESDLAKVEVQTATNVANACGSRLARPAGVKSHSER